MAPNLNPDTSGMGGSVSPGLLIPKRNPRLIDRIAGLIFKAQPQTGPQPTQQQTTESGITVQALQSVFDQYFKSQSDRLAVYKDVDEMDMMSEECSVALDTIADNTTTSEDGIQMSFQVASDDEKVAAILEQVNKDAGLHTIVYSLVRNLVKYGDGFLEIVVNAEGQLTQLRQLPPSTMFRNQDSKGNLVLGQPRYDEVSGACQNMGGECAFEQRAEDTQSIVAAFWPWQIVHMRLNHDGFKPYGRSHLRVSRIIWKKLHAIDEAMIIARLARAYPKYLFKVDTTGLSKAEAEVAITEVQQRMNQRQAIDGRREQPYWILSDVYFGVPKVKDSQGKFNENATNVSVLESQGQTVFNIDDVKSYFHRKLLITLRVPPAHMGWEEQVNAKATLGQQDVQYVRFLRRLQQQIGQALEQVYDTALVLAGIDPTEAEYEISWPMLSAADEAAAADAEFSRAQADNLYAQLSVIDAEWIQRHRFDLTDEEIAELQKRMAAANEAAQQQAGQDGQEEDDEPPPPPPMDEDDEDKEENQGRERLSSEEQLEQAWSDAARASALAHRRSKAGSAAAQVARDSLKDRQAYQKQKLTGRSRHGVHTGTHSHSHSHGNRIHSHSHTHNASSSHSHSHSRHVYLAEAEPELEQVEPRQQVTSVALLSEAIKGRALALLEREFERVLDEQREALRRARAMNEDVA